MTSSEAARIVALLISAFPTPAWTDDCAKLYREMLLDLDADPTKRAVVALVQTRDSTHRPPVAAIRDAVRQQLEASRAIPTELSFDQAWGFVVKCRTTVGRYREFPRQPFPMVAEAVEQLGWETLCNSDNPEADRAHFFRVYGACAERSRIRRLTAPGQRLPTDPERLAAQAAALAPRKPPLNAPPPAIAATA